MYRHFRAQPPKLSYEQQTADADLADCRQRFSRAECQKRTEAGCCCDYAALRDTLNAYRATVATWQGPEWDQMVDSPEFAAAFQNGFRPRPSLNC